MGKQAVGHTDHFAEVMRIMGARGLLVGSYDAERKANLMTIGWGTVGIAWQKPVWVVMVRPSRYTYKNIERGECFTVNVPTADMAKTCSLCGSKSGRDTDKFAACGLTAEPAGLVEAPIVAESPLVYECKVVHKNDVLSPHLAEEIRKTAYAGGDFHRIFWGEILATRAEPDAAQRLAR
jgi:flavin reductase (DIM6/NTAB) family NADH-FMN oxidoreductase RutF